MNRGFERFAVAHFPDEHHVRVFADGVLHPDFEVANVLADFALVDQALFFGEHKLDRVFERQNVLVVVFVDPVEHRRDRRRLPGTGNAGEQNHPLAELAEFVKNRRNVQLFEFRNEVVNTPRDEADVPHLRQNVDAETPSNAVDDAGVREVRPAGVVVNFAVAFVHHREDEAVHFFVVDGAAVERAQAPLDADVRRTVDFQVKVAPGELDQRLEEAVDFKFLLFSKDAIGRRAGFGSRHTFFFSVPLASSRNARLPTPLRLAISTKFSILPVFVVRYFSSTRSSPTSLSRPNDVDALMTLLSALAFLEAQPKRSIFVDFRRQTLGVVGIRTGIPAVGVASFASASIFAVKRSASSESEPESRRLASLP